MPEEDSCVIANVDCDGKDEDASYVNMNKLCVLCRVCLPLSSRTLALPGGKGRIRRTSRGDCGKNWLTGTGTGETFDGFIARNCVNVS